jgi:DNA-binding protein HU-beta
MNKSELIDAMAAKANLSKVDTKAALEAFMDVTESTLAAGDRLALIGFGTFSVSNRPARKGRNPQTGKVIQIEAKKVVKFKAGSALVDAVN